jgi:hypothetical protein
MQSILLLLMFLMRVIVAIPSPGEVDVGLQERGEKKHVSVPSAMVC